MIFWSNSHILCKTFLSWKDLHFFLSESWKFSKSYGKSLHTQTPVLGQNTPLNLVTSDCFTINACNGRPTLYAFKRPGLIMV